MVRILIADDHPIFRDGLKRLLEEETDLRVVGEAGDGEAAVKLARQLHPDLLLLDLMMPRRSGMEVLRDLASPSWLARTVILAAEIGKDQIIEALQLGARGIILKESATQFLLSGIRQVMSGQYWIGHDGVSNLVRVICDTLPAREKAPERKNYDLTARELEIVTAILTGCTNKDISKKFAVSERTVKHHLTVIFDKVGVSSRLELALFAMNHHLVNGDAS